MQIQHAEDTCTQGAASIGIISRGCVSVMEFVCLLVAVLEVAQRETSSDGCRGAHWVTAMSSCNISGHKRVNLESAERRWHTGVSVLA